MFAHIESLVVFQGTLLHASEPRTLQRASGSEAVWSDDGRTYALLFQGSPEQMHAYMNRWALHPEILHQRVE